MIKTILAGLLAILILLFGGFFVADVLLKSTVGVDMVGTVAGATMIAQPVDESALITNPYNETSEMKSVQQKVNASVANMITYSQENGYRVNFNNLPDNMKTIIALSDKEVAALSSVVLKQEAAGQIQVKDLYMDVKIHQVEFEKNTEGTVLVNSVISIETASFKEAVPAESPLASFLGVIPDSLYVSSTVAVTKGEEPFTYQTEYVDFTINNLNEKQSESFFHTVDVITGVGTAEYIGLQIGNTLIDALVGSQTTKGLAYSLRSIGAKGFAFVEHADGIYFEVQR